MEMDARFCRLPLRNRAQDGAKVDKIVEYQKESASVIR